MQLTIDLTDDVAEVVRAIAAARGVPETEVVVEALALFADHQAEVEARIAQGRADIAAGRFVEHAAVVAWLRSWVTENELPPPRCD